MSGKKRTIIAPILTVVLLVVATGAILVAIKLFTVPTDLDFSEPVEVTVPRGATLWTMAAIFREAGMIEHRWQFVLSARFTGLDRKLRAGRYKFTEPLSAIQLVKALTVGGSFDVSITFPEGSTIFEVAEIAAESLDVNVDSLIALCFDRTFLDSLGIPGPSCEGYLFPETYSLPEDISEKELLRRMYAHFRTVWTDSLKTRANVLGFGLNEALTLASIIEGEAKVAWERPIISSVYHNRLRIGMLLQADPTVIYGLRCFDRLLTKADLDTSKTLYNTYKYAGLPPGPINNPGLGSIVAALWPDSSDYLYFVSNRGGTHWFTKDLTAHQAAIRAIRDLRKHGPTPKVYNRKLLKNNSI